MDQSWHFVTQMNCNWDYKHLDFFPSHFFYKVCLCFWAAGKVRSERACFIIPDSNKPPLPHNLSLTAQPSSISSFDKSPTMSRAPACSSGPPPWPPHPSYRIPTYRKLIGRCSGYPPVTLISACPLVYGRGPDTLCCSGQSPAMRRLLHLSGQPCLVYSKMGSGWATDLREVTDTLQFVLLPYGPCFTIKHVSLRLSPQSLLQKKNKGCMHFH